MHIAVRLSSAACLACLLCAPAPALAFCRTRTCEFDGTQACETDPVTECKSGGELARWEGGCVSYAVQVDGSEAQGISAATLRDLVEDGFRAWTSAECSVSLPGGTPQFSAVYRGETSCDAVEYNCGADEDNANIVMFRDGSSDLSRFTIALSTIIANLRTGEILDVDVEINSRDFDFYVEDADARDEAHDLRLVINHELGHFLGLSHTRAAGALMRAEYAGSDRLPARDDVNGMCEIFPIATSDPSCSAPAALDECLGADSRCPVAVQSDDGGCSLGQSASGLTPAAALGLAVLAGLSRRRRRVVTAGRSAWPR